MNRLKYPEIVFLVGIILLFNSSCKKEENKKVESPISNSFFTHFEVNSYFDTDMTLDKNNNVYLTGAVGSPYGIRSLNFSGISILSRGSLDAYIVKYDQNGKTIWAKLLGGIKDDVGNAIAVDENENIYVAGKFRNSIMIDETELKIKTFPNPGNFESANDIFLAKFDKNGKKLWVKLIAGSYAESPTSLAIDKNGRIYLSGYFNDNIYFNDTLHSANGTAFFITCYDSSGALTWAKTYGSINSTNYNGAGGIYPEKLKVSKKGDLIVYGTYEGMKKIGPHIINSKGESDIFLLKLTQEGETIWLKTMDGIGKKIGMGLCLDDSDNIYVSGFFFNQINIDQFSLNSTTGEGFLASYNQTGSVNWTTKIDGNEVFIYDLTEYNNKLYITGTYRSIGFFNDIKLNGYYYNGFTATYSTAGKIELAEKLGGANALPVRIKVDNNGYKIVMGSFDKSFNFNEKTYNISDERHTFLIKY